MFFSKGVRVLGDFLRDFADIIDLIPSDGANKTNSPSEDIDTTLIGFLGDLSQFIGDFLDALMEIIPFSDSDIEKLKLANATFQDIGNILQTVSDTVENTT